jgi:putative tricarboxylic transport membrane protein
MVVGAGLILCGALIALGIGQRFEEEAEADLAAHSDQAPAKPRAQSWWRRLMVLVPPGLLLFYVFTVDRLGFLLTATIIVLTAALALGARLRLALPLAIGAPLVVHLIFAKLLRVPLPWGLVPPPW